MSRIVDRSREVIDQHGRLAMSFYTSGQLFAEEYYALAVLARGGIGTPHLDGNTRLCTATTEWALVESFGSDGDPGSYTDIDSCDTLFIVGHNVAETQTVLWMRILDRLHGPDRPKLVVVDPATHASSGASRHPSRDPHWHECRFAERDPERTHRQRRRRPRMGAATYRRIRRAGAGRRPILARHGR